jgi:peptidoglycan biosynthesis protein MviN/MurJ (putative lipid II flippase)
MAFLALGDIVTATIYQSGRLSGSVTVCVWAILAGSTVGMLAPPMGRLYASTYFALRDTRTPNRFAILRVFAAVLLGYVAAIPPPPLFHGGACVGVVRIGQFCHGSGLRGSRGLRHTEADNQDDGF